MRTTGMVRKIDDQGRLVIPMELRRTMDWQEGAPLEIFTDGDKVVLKKYQPGCIFCGSLENVENHKGKNICRACLTEIGKQVG